VTRNPSWQKKIAKREVTNITPFNDLKSRLFQIDPEVPQPYAYRQRSIGVSLVSFHGIDMPG
jgi:hypothetical protein